MNQRRFIGTITSAADLLNGYIEAKLALDYADARGEITLTLPESMLSELSIGKLVRINIGEEPCQPKS